MNTVVYNIREVGDLPENDEFYICLGAKTQRSNSIITLYSLYIIAMVLTIIFLISVDGISLYGWILALSIWFALFILYLYDNHINTIPRENYEHSANKYALFNTIALVISILFLICDYHFLMRNN